MNRQYILFFPEENKYYVEPLIWEEALHACCKVKALLNPVANGYLDCLIYDVINEEWV